MLDSYAMKKSILEKQAELAALQDEYALARAREKAAQALALAEKAAQAARDMENVMETRARKRAERLRAALANL